MIIYPLSNINFQLINEIKKIGCDERSIPIFANKTNIIPIKITDIKPSLANIIKQEMISCKGDAVIHSKSISCEIEKTDILLLGTLSIYYDFISKIEKQNYKTLNDITYELKKIIINLNTPTLKITTRNNKELNFNKPILMGILNITDDSFYDGGKYKNFDVALKRCEEMIKEGANIIDIGGESTRPGSDPIPLELEMNRVLPIVEKVYKEFNIIISVDTYKSKVAEEALKLGADIINDISGMTFDEKMINVVKNMNSIVIIMHIKGKPKDMQLNPHYDDVIKELIEYFDERINFAINNGIKRDNIIIDPGIGFGKKLEHNLEIMRNLPAFKKYGLPLLLGASRKSMIGMILGDTDKFDEKCLPPSERLYGTLGVNSYGYYNGVNIFRVHDVKFHKEMLKVLNKILYNN